MQSRFLGALVLAGGAAGVLWALRRPAGVDWTFDADGLALDPAADASDYLARMSLAENPWQNPFAKNPGSSASGLFQFVRSTWEALGGAWGSDPRKAFGGLTPSIADQTAMAARLTAQNAAILQAAGLAASNVNLYAIHILGPTAGLRALAAPDATRLAAIIGADAVARNPALGQTVGSFRDYLQRKVG